MTWKRPEHVGRAWTVYLIVGYTRVHGGLYKNVNYDDRGSVPMVDMSTNFCGFSDGFGERIVDHPPI
ncbi:hypothetical protein M8C21_030952, partial [Ambrosia artemisiifolia]